MRNRSPWRRILTCAAPAVLAACASVPDAAVPPAMVLEGERLFPESITSDAAGNIYVGSNPGRIFRARAGERVAYPWIVPDAANGLATVFGVLVDEGRGLLWVCSNPRQGQAGGAPAILTFRLRDGALTASYPLAIEGPAMCNDMTVGPDGEVYASETLGGRVLRLANGGTAFTEWARDPAFATADGIVWGGDGQLYVNAIQRNNLVRANRDATGRFIGATVLTPSRPMGGPDGLRALGGNRFLQSEGNAGLITLVTIEGDRAEIVTLADGVDYASAVTAHNGRAFYPEGKLRFLFGPQTGQDPGAFVVRNVAIPEGE
jgi:sugar lactone lactonase YvrE